MAGLVLVPWNDPTLYRTLTVTLIESPHGRLLERGALTQASQQTSLFRPFPKLIPYHTP